MDYQLILFGTKEDEFESVMKTFNISKEMLDENLEKLRHWIKSQPHLCHLEIEKNILKRYLFGKMFCLERAKSRIEKVHIYRALSPQFFSNKNINDPELWKIFDVVNMCVMPQKLPDNGRIFIASLNCFDPNVFDAFAFVKVFFMISDLRIRYETHSYSYSIIDCANISVIHFLKLLSFTQFSRVSEDCYEDRMKTVLFINFPEKAYGVLAKIKTFLKKSVADKFQINKDSEILHKIIPLEYLPSDYGGKQMSCREISLKLRDAMSTPEICEWYSEQEKQKSNEEQRVKNHSIDNDDFSCFGTYRKIDID